MMDDDMIGAIKIKDGLFIGDSFAAKDLEFVVANKVSRVINCCGRQVQNQWTNIGVEYLTYTWLDEENQILFDSTDKTTNEIYNFIQDAMNQYESVLVHSVRGQSRASCVIASYMMRHYRWSLLKTLEFLNSRRPDLEIRATFIKQLSQYENRLKSRGLGPQTSKWDEISEENKFLESEELMLRNTFLNAQSGPVTQLGPGALTSTFPQRLRLLKWRDTVTDTNNSKQKGQRGYSASVPRLSLALMTEPRRDLVNLQAVKPQVNHHRMQHITHVRPIIKKARSMNDISNIYVSMYQRKNQTTPMLNESRSFRNDQGMPMSSNDQKNNKAAGQYNLQDNQIRGYNNNSNSNNTQNNIPMYKNQYNITQVGAHQREGDASPMNRDGQNHVPGPGGANINPQQQQQPGYQRFQQQNAQRGVMARQSNHTPQNLSQIFHPKQQNAMEKQNNNIGNERSPTEGSISEHNYIGSQIQSSAKSSQRNEGQKYINVLPRSNPTGTISSIQDRFNQGNNSMHQSQKGGSQQHQQQLLNASLNTTHNSQHLNTSQTIPNSMPYPGQTQMQGQGQGQGQSAGTLGTSPSISSSAAPVRSQGQGHGYVDNPNSYDNQNQGPGGSYSNQQQRDMRENPGEKGSGDEFVRKGMPFGGEAGHSGENNKGISSYPQQQQTPGQQHQQVSNNSQPQYITNIYNTINTNILDKDAPQQNFQAIFMGPTLYTGGTNMPGLGSQPNQMGVQQQPNLSQQPQPGPLHQLQPQTTPHPQQQPPPPPGYSGLDNQISPQPSNPQQQITRSAAGQVRSPNQEIHSMNRSGQLNSSNPEYSLHPHQQQQQRPLHPNDSLYNQNRLQQQQQSFGQEQHAKGMQDQRSTHFTNPTSPENSAPSNSRIKRLGAGDNSNNDQKSDRNREFGGRPGVDYNNNQLVYDQHNQMIQSFDDRKQQQNEQQQQDRMQRELNADPTLQHSQFVDMTQSASQSRDNPSSSHTNLNVSNLSNIQKELRPNKVVNKGNSVFGNHHKLVQNSGKNMPIKAMPHYDSSQMHQMQQNMQTFQKLNAHQIIKQTTGQKHPKGSSGIQVLHNVKNVRMSVRDSVQSQPMGSGQGSATKGPTIGGKSENLVHTGDNQAVNSSGITSASAHSKKAGASQKFSKGSVKYAEDKGPNRDGTQGHHQQNGALKRGGSARPMQHDKQNGIIMGSHHGITSQVPPKDGSKVAGGSHFNQKSKTTRGESPIVKPSNQLLPTNSGQQYSKNGTHHTMVIKQNQFHPSGHQYVGGSGPPSAKGTDNKLHHDINAMNHDKKPNSGRAALGMSNSNSYGAVMARGGNIQQATSPLTINFIKMGQGQQQINGPQSSSNNKHHIGFKTDRVPNQTFKSGGPIRATGAAVENMGQIDMLHPQGGQFEKHQSKQNLMPSSIGSSKMPQRPGSSKPPQKQNLLDNDPSFSSKRPESPSQKKPGQQSKHVAINKGRLRSASPNTQMMQQNISRTGSNNPRGDSQKNPNRKHQGPSGASHLQQNFMLTSTSHTAPGSTPQNTSHAGGGTQQQTHGGVGMSMKGKGRVNKMEGGGGLPGTMIAGSKGLNAKALQQNYMRGYSPSKPLWK